MSTSPVLLVGGYGAVGAHAARTLRALHPSLPLLIAGRRLEPAETLARSLGNARAVTVDLAQPDFGLDEHLAIDAVAMFVKDSGLNGLRTATKRAVPYMTMSEYAFDIAPAVARWAHAAGRIPMMLLGHHLGGLATLTALHYAQEFADVLSIRIGALFDETTSEPQPRKPTQRSPNAFLPTHSACKQAAGPGQTSAIPAAPSKPPTAHHTQPTAARSSTSSASPPPLKHAT